MVELMLSTTILAIVLLGVAPYFVAAGRYEANTRRVAFARTSLALGLERLERIASLSRAATEEGASTVALAFPGECGGVSFETNRLAGVVSARLAADSSSVRATLALRRGFGADATDLAERRIAADPLLFAGGASRYSITGFSATNLPSCPGLVRLSVTAEVPQRNSAGEVFYRPVSVGRYARLWNR